MKNWKKKFCKNAVLINTRSIYCIEGHSFERNNLIVKINFLIKSSCDRQSLKTQQS